MNSDGEDRLESVVAALFYPTNAGGVYGRTALFEQVIDGLSTLISRKREPQTEVLRFPPVMSRTDIEKSGYLHSFPHLLGAVSCLRGSEAEIRGTVDGSKSPGGWTAALAPTELVLTPAACYPLYPLVSARGPVPENGLLFDVACDCFRHEASQEIGRLQSFRMREFVCMGSPSDVVEFRTRWISRATELADILGLSYQIEQASDPFFGRAGKLMAINQIEQSLKFELLIPIRSDEAPTACMSFNYHREHFGTVWELRNTSGETVHTACVAFGLDRLALALFVRHGLNFRQWPNPVRESLMVGG
jgi:seryl-tRNA synthetase